MSIKLRTEKSLLGYANGELFAKTVYFVEANSNETHYIWKEHKFNQINPMPVVLVGHVGEYEIWCSFYFVSIKNKIVCFYSCTSYVECHPMVEDWIKHHVNPKTTDDRTAITDGQNFHNVIHEINRILEQEKTIDRWTGNTK